MPVAALCLVQFIDVMGVTVVITSLPDMLVDLGASVSSGSLVATGYAMFFGGLLMLGARLGDRYGNRLTIVVSLGVFAVAAVVAALAPSVAVLTAARCLQGAAAAASVPSALKLLTTVTDPGAQRQGAIAAWSASGAMAGATGFVVGGVLTDLTGWRTVFWVYVPLAVLLAVVIARVVPGDEDADRTLPLNVVGATLFTSAVMCFVLGTTLVTEPAPRLYGVALVAVSLLLVVGFVAVDSRAFAPLLPRSVLRLPQVSHGATGGLLNTATTSGVVTLATLYLQDALGHSPLTAAAMLLPFSLAVIVGAAAAAAALRRWTERQVVALGLAVIGAADLLVIWGAPSPWGLPACVAFAGAGIGLSSVAATALGTSVEPDLRGTASGIVNTTAQLGTALGITVLIVLAAATTGAPAPAAPVPGPAWGATGVTALVGAAAFMLWNRRATARAVRHRTSAPPRTR